MPRHLTPIASRLAALAAACLVCGCALAAGDDDRLAEAVAEAAQSVMSGYDVPGMAVAVTAQGRRRVFNFGVAEPGGERPVTDRTIFEIGSVSKTFTATLAAHAVASGRLSLSDKAGRLLPDLAGSAIGDATVGQLGTYTAGGLPLQFPDAVANEAAMLAYFREWTPSFSAGSERLYSNPSIGLFGLLAARSMGGDFDDLMQTNLLPAFGLSQTATQMPADRMTDYAWGQARDGRRIRLAPGILGSQAYGIRTTASDLLRFVEANLDPSGLGETWRRAVAITHEARFRVGSMMQGLGWEAYPYPVALDDLLAGNGTDIAMKPNPVRPLGDPPSDLLFDKTGSTNGFGAYVLFVPSRRVGIVILANRNYPIPARIRAAYSILSALR